MHVDADLLSLFGAECGIVCAVGAGGKKSILYRLAAAHPGRIALTATVGTTAFPPSLGLEAVVAPPAEIASRVLALADHDRMGVACPHARADRLAGIEPALVAMLHEQTGRELTLVKADGARMRWLKAPQPGEPVLPPGCATAIVVVSARALGQPLTERVAHRLDRIVAVTGARVGEPVTPALLARLFTRPGGLLDGLAAGRVIPTINMVDDDEALGPAMATARAIVGSTSGIRKVILTSMKRATNPVVAVVEP